MPLCLRAETPVVIALRNAVELGLITLTDIERMGLEDCFHRWYMRTLGDLVDRNKYIAQHHGSTFFQNRTTAEKQKLRRMLEAAGLPTHHIG